MAVIDFDIAIHQHLNWMTLVASLFNESDSRILNPTVIVKDNDCELGQWLINNSDNFAGHDIFQQLVRTHKTFHVLAGQIILSFQSGDGMTDEVKAMQQAFHNNSDNIILLLRQLRDQLNDKSS